MDHQFLVRQRSHPAAGSIVLIMQPILPMYEPLRMETLALSAFISSVGSDDTRAGPRGPPVAKVSLRTVRILSMIGIRMD